MTVFKRKFFKNAILAIFGRFSENFQEFSRILKQKCQKQGNGHAFSPTRVQVSLVTVIKGERWEPGCYMGGGSNQKRAFLDVASLSGDFCNFSITKTGK